MRRVAVLLALSCACVRQGPPSAGREPGVDIIEVTVIAAVPRAYVGRWVAGRAEVLARLGDRAFYVGREGQRLLVVVHEPAGIAVDVTRGERVRVTGLLLPGAAATQLGGLPADVVAAALAEERFLAVHAGDVLGPGDAVGDGVAASPRLAVLFGWDGDGDGVVCRDELRAGVLRETGLPRWDLDRSGGFDADELDAAVFSALDVDRDRRVSRVEWQAGSDAWFGASVAPESWRAWDRDASGGLDRVEVARWMREAGVLAAWDADADEHLSADELADGAVAAWDLDAEGTVAWVAPVPRPARTVVTPPPEAPDEPAPHLVGLGAPFELSVADLVHPIPGVEASLFDLFDVDRDGRIDPGELYALQGALLDDITYVAFQAWDLDGDGWIAPEEFFESISGFGLWSAMRRDLGVQPRPREWADRLVGDWRLGG